MLSHNANSVLLLMVDIFFFKKNNKLLLCSLSITLLELLQHHKSSEVEGELLNELLWVILYPLGRQKSPLCEWNSLCENMTAMAPPTCSRQPSRGSQMQRKSKYPVALEWGARTSCGTSLQKWRGWCHFKTERDWLREVIVIFPTALGKTLHFRRDAFILGWNCMVTL